MGSTRGTSVMGVGAQTRTMFAGFGVSGSLIAAVGAAFAVAGGVLAFDQWPHAALRSSDPESVNVAAVSPSAASKSAAQAPSVALPPAASAALPTSLGQDRDAVRPQGRTPGGQPQVIAVGTIPAVGVPQAPPAGAGSPQPASGPATTSSNAVADTIDSVTQTAARSVRDAGNAVPAAAPVTNTVASTAESAGALVSSTVRGLTGR